MAQAQTALHSLGFQKTKDAWLLPLGEIVSGWVGLNSVSRPDGRVGINPVVGVRNEQIENLLKHLSENRFVSPPSISTSLGYLMPESRYLEWLFEPDPFDYKSECQRMIGAIEVYGIPFMKSNRSLDTIVEHLQNRRYTWNESIVYRLPVACLVLGDTSTATSYVKGELVKLGARKDDAAQDYRRFADRLLAHLNSK